MSVDIKTYFKKLFQKYKMFRPSHWKTRRSDYMEQDPHRPMLHVMCRDGNTHVVKQLVEYAANINTRCDFGYTPLHYAAEYGHLDIVKILHGA